MKPADDDAGVHVLDVVARRGRAAPLPHDDAIADDHAQRDQHAEPVDRMSETARTAAVPPK